MTGEKDSSKTKEEYQNKRKGCVVGDLPPPPPAGSSQLEDNAYSPIRAFEVEQMTYVFRFCEVCKERQL